MIRNIAIAVFPLITISSNALATNVFDGHLSSDSVINNMHLPKAHMLVNDSITLDEVIVDGNSNNKYLPMRSSLNVISLEKNYIDNNFSGSLMQTLDKLPGVKSMNVGASESKPIIRGLGFNRVVVTDNGVKYEGQQWGDDHGLETDQFLVEMVEVMKGPSALAYGSDAIGGVINLHSDAIPNKRFSGGAKLFARSNNQSIGATSHIKGRSGKFWYKMNVTSVDYADYKVPVDSIQYFSYYIKLKDRLLRNTAGKELDGSMLLGYDGKRYKGYLRFSDVNNKSGFFANAHGIEVRLSKIDYDKSRRDIDMPYHSANHMFLSSHNEYLWTGGVLEGDFSLQNNKQREYSERISHGYMPIPPDNLERSFDKYTLSGNINMRTRLGNHTLRIGVSGDYQHNTSGGWGFILPDYEQAIYGSYISDRYVVNDGLVISAGVRYDHANINIHSYRDWFQTPTDDGNLEYMQRSPELSRSFDSFTWSLGINKDFGKLVLKSNIGKSFRIPIAKELGADGVNYSIFRYERGNTTLSPEQSYQIDAGLVYDGGSINIEMTPYINYFPNYIYLNPTPNYVEGLQLYSYTQSEVLRWGFEGEVKSQFLRNYEIHLGGEYLYARQLSGDKKGYTLPFSTPWSARLGVKYKFLSHDGDNTGFVLLEWNVVGSQNEVVPPEEPTKGYQLLNASVSKIFRVGKNILKTTLNCENLFNKRYYDHTSYYRLIGVPEPGRNVSVMVGWEF